MDFDKTALLCNCLSRDYAGEFLRLLATYESISSSEAASRLNIHIQTTQDFLEDLYMAGVVDREEVSEGKRPYFRYRLRTRRITIDIDLDNIFGSGKPTGTGLSLRIRERANSGARFTTSRTNDYISSVVIWEGEGRNRTERKINLSLPQGKFLFHLPFPTAGYSNLAEIMKRAGVDNSNAPEIIDIVEVLIDYGVIETIF